MSGVLKKIGKVFRKVVKTVKKIAPYALAAAAVVFTGGAAFNVLPTFATAMGGLAGSLGLSAGLTTAVGGALTNAGFGAAIGGVLGGKKGMQMGALAGAVSGGFMGAVASPTASLSSQLPGASGASQALSTITPGAASTVPLSTTALAAPVASAAAAPVSSGLLGSMGGSVGSGGGLLGNPLVTSQLIQGLGSGITNASAAKEQRKAEERIAGNYSINGGLLDPTVLNGTGTPNDGAFDPNTQGKWTYDARQGKLVKG